MLAEPMAQASDATGQGCDSADAYFHFYLLAMGAGRLRTPQELQELMKEAGFTHVELLNNDMPIHARILLGRKSQCLPLVSGKSVN